MIGGYVAFREIALRQKDGSMIPQQYTCEGDDISPPLDGRPLAEGTQSIALIVDDPDAPAGTFVHWVLYDLPAGETKERLLDAMGGAGSRPGTDYGQVPQAGVTAVPRRREAAVRLEAVPECRLFSVHPAVGAVYCGRLGGRAAE